MAMMSLTYADVCTLQNASTYIGHNITDAAAAALLLDSCLPSSSNSYHDIYYSVNASRSNAERNNYDTCHRNHANIDVNRNNKSNDSNNDIDCRCNTNNESHSSYAYCYNGSGCFDRCDDYRRNSAQHGPHSDSYRRETACGGCAHAAPLSYSPTSVHSNLVHPESPSSVSAAAVAAHMLWGNVALITPVVVEGEQTAWSGAERDLADDHCAADNSYISAPARRFDCMERRRQQQQQQIATVLGEHELDGGEREKTVCALHNDPSPSPRDPRHPDMPGPLPIPYHETESAVHCAKHGATEALSRDCVVDDGDAMRGHCGVPAALKQQQHTQEEQHAQQNQTISEWDCLPERHKQLEKRDPNQSRQPPPLSSQPPPAADKSDHSLIPQTNVPNEEDVHRATASHRWALADYELLHRLDRRGPILHFRGQERWAGGARVLIQCVPLPACCSVAHTSFDAGVVAGGMLPRSKSRSPRCSCQACDLSLALQHAARCQRRLSREHRYIRGLHVCRVAGQQAKNEHDRGAAKTETCATGEQAVANGDCGNFSHYKNDASSYCCGDGVRRMQTSNSAAEDARVGNMYCYLVYEDVSEGSLRDCLHETGGATRDTGLGSESIDSPASYSVHDIFGAREAPKRNRLVRALLSDDPADTTAKPHTEEDAPYSHAWAVRRVVRQLVSAVAFMHEYGVVHGNISPDSVYVHHEEVRLSDWALSSLLRYHPRDESCHDQTRRAHVEAAHRYGSSNTVRDKNYSNSRHGTNCYQYYCDSNDNKRAMSYCAPERLTGQILPHCSSRQSTHTSLPPPARLCDDFPSRANETPSAHKASDLWSVGVLCYTLLCGYDPFEDSDDDKRRALIERAIVYFPDYLDDDARSFLRGLLCVCPRERMTAAQALQHNFLKPKSQMQSNVRTDRSWWAGQVADQTRSPREEADAAPSGQRQLDDAPQERQPATMSPFTKTASWRAPDVATAARGETKARSDVLAASPRCIDADATDGHSALAETEVNVSVSTLSLSRTRLFIPAVGEERTTTTTARDAAAAAAARISLDPTPSLFTSYSSPAAVPWAQAEEKGKSQMTSIWNSHSCRRQSSSSAVSSSASSASSGMCVDVSSSTLTLNSAAHSMIDMAYMTGPVVRNESEDSNDHVDGEAVSHSMICPDMVDDMYGLVNKYADDRVPGSTAPSSLSPSPTRACHVRAGEKGNVAPAWTAQYSRRCASSSVRRRDAGDLLARLHRPQRKQKQRCPGGAAVSSSSLPSSSSSSSSSLMTSWLSLHSASRHSSTNKQTSWPYNKRTNYRSQRGASGASDEPDEMISPRRASRDGASSHGVSHSNPRAHSENSVGEVSGHGAEEFGGARSAKIALAVADCDGLCLSRTLHYSPERE